MKNKISVSNFQKPRQEKSDTSDIIKSFNGKLHKQSERECPKVSLILLDWNCREKFFALEWLAKQDVPREQYEIIWIDLYDRVHPAPMEKADTVITLGQKGIYHKHVGYNAGLLYAKGEIVTICDSDAVFPANFISSILNSFKAHEGREIPLVLMHYQWRTSFRYPDGLKEISELGDKKWEWWPLHPNVGACMSIRKEDAIKYGGFDEDESYRGYICGPYDLGWRLVNAGIPEIWHDPVVALWHFAHPDPVGVNGLTVSLKSAIENTYPHVEWHACTAIEAFSTGQMLPRKENKLIFEMRLKNRVVGTPFEERYASYTSQNGFSKSDLLKLRLKLTLDLLSKFFGIRAFLRFFHKLVGNRIYEFMRKLRYLYLPGGDADARPVVLKAIKGYNIVLYKARYFGIPRSLGPVDLNKDEDIFKDGVLVENTIKEVTRKIRLAH